MPQSMYFNIRGGSARTSVVGLNGVMVDLPDTAPTNIEIQYCDQSAAGSLTFVPSPDSRYEPHSLIYQIPPRQNIENFSVSGLGLGFKAPEDHMFGRLDVAIAGGTSDLGNVHSRTVQLASTGAVTDATGLRCDYLRATSTGGAFHAPAAEKVSLINDGSQLFTAVSESPTARFSLSNRGGSAEVIVPSGFKGEFSAVAMGGSVFANGGELEQSSV